MKKPMTVLGALTLFVLSAPAAYAAGEATGTVTEILMLNDFPSVLFVKVSGAIVGSPACNNQNRFVVSTETSPGKQYYAWILAAKQSGATITLYGSNSCNLVFNSEDLRGISQL